MGQTEQNKNHIQYKIRREIAGYDSKGNPIYREVKVAVRPEVVRRRSVPAQNAPHRAPTNGTVTRRTSASKRSASKSATHQPNAAAYRNPKTVKRHKKKSIVKRVIAPLICAAVIIGAAVGVYVVYRNSLAYKDNPEEAVGVTEESIVQTFKVDSSHRIVVYKSSGELCASLLKLSGTGDDAQYKLLKSCDSLNLSSFAEDLKGKSIDYSKSDGICFALDYSTSEQYGDYADYISDNAEKSFKPGAISVEEDESTIFVLWYWTE